MGLLWNLLQDSKINEQKEKAEGIEERVARLEHELRDTRVLLHKLIKVLEENVGRDIDGDGKVG
jgi:hypothetical protein